MDTSKDYIYQNAVNIINDAEILSPPELEEKYKEFKEKFYKIYVTCVGLTPETKQSFLNELKLFLGIREEVISGKKSMIEANVQVGDYQGKRYLYPITGEPTMEQKKQYIKKVVREEEEKKKKGQE
jgi:hypothetical protein